MLVASVSAAAQTAPIPQLTPGIISTVAGKYYNGNLTYSGDGGAAINAQLGHPESVALDAARNLYIADTDNMVIRVVNLQSTAITVLGVVIEPGDIETVVGLYGSGNEGFSGDGGPAGQAGLALPTGLKFDAQGNLYFADSANGRIRVVNMQSTEITLFGVTIQPGDINTVAGDGSVTTGNYTTCAGATDVVEDGCPATQSGLISPQSVALDAVGNLYIADYAGFRVRKVSSTSNVISTAAGTGTNGYSGDGGDPVQAELFDPNSVQIDAAGNIYIAEIGSNRVRVVNTQVTAITLYGITIQPNTIETMAGSGTAVANQSGNTSGGYSGDGGPANQAHLENPNGIWLDGVGDLYIADTGNNVIREVNVQSGTITTIAGDSFFPGSNNSSYTGDGGSATSAEIYNPSNVMVDTQGNLWIADTMDEAVREVSTGEAIVTFPLTYPGSLSPNQTVTLQNIGGSDLVLSGDALGGTDPPSFSVDTTCPTALSSGASCTFKLSFEPTTSGPLASTVTVTETTPSASQVIILNGTGNSTTWAQVSVTPSQLSFGNQMVGTTSASQPITLTNTGTATLSPSGAETSILAILGPNAGDAI